MPKNRKKNKKPDLSELLSNRDFLKTGALEDGIIHAADFPLLCLIGVDSANLERAFYEFIKEKSPGKVAKHKIGGEKNSFNILRNAETLDNKAFHVFPLFDYRAAAPAEVAGNLIFYRDYIPQYRLKIILICSHQLLKTIIEKAYDFYSIASFCTFFNDLSRSVREDLSEYKGKPEAIREFEKKLKDLNSFKKKKNIIELPATAAHGVAKLYSSQKKSSQKKKISTNNSIDSILLNKLYNTARSAYKISSLNTAMELYGEALKIAIKIKDVEYRSSIYANMSLIYQGRGELDEALKFQKQSLEINRKIGSLQNEAASLGNIGSIYQNKGQLDEALKFQKQSLEINRKIGSLQNEAASLGNIGSIYQNKGQLNEALKYYKQALQIAREIGYLQGEAIQLGNIGLIYRDKGQLDEALKYLKISLTMAQKAGFKKIITLTQENITKIEEMKKKPHA
jgi:tetratricopeptide (TPR) repeat protein